MGEFLKYSSHYAAVLPYNLNWKIDPAPLQSFLSKNPITVFDIGARGNDLGEIDSLKKYMNYICFDADEEECARLNKQPKNEFNGFSVLPYFLGEDSKEIDFHIYKMPAESSSYRPNLQFKKLYSPTLEIDRTVKIKSQTLDSIVVQQNLDEPDFIKIDTQGSELSILKNSLSTLSNTFLIEIEVEFAKIYDGQPLFHEVDMFMSAQGYQLLYLNRVFQSRQEYVGESRGIVTFGDALYGKTSDLQNFLPEKLAKYIILLINYGHLDIAYAIWKENSEVRDVAPAISQFFKPRYPMETQLEIANMDKFICWLLTKRRTNQLLLDSDRSWPFR